MEKVVNLDPLPAECLEGVSPAYLAAVDAHNAAQRVYWAVRDAFDAGKVGDAEYLVAHKAMAEADKAFDAAYAAEAGR